MKLTYHTILLTRLAYDFSNQLRIITGHYHLVLTVQLLKMNHEAWPPHKVFTPFHCSHKINLELPFHLQIYNQIHAK